MALLLCEIRTVDFEARTNAVLARVAKRHPAASYWDSYSIRQYHLGYTDLKKSDLWERSRKPWNLRKKWLVALAVDAPLAAVAFLTMSRVSAIFVGLAVLAVSACVVGFTQEDPKRFGRLPDLLRAFFRVRQAKFSELAKKCEAFDTMIVTAPHLLETVSNKDALLATWKQRRDALDTEVEAYLKELQLVEAIYWTAQHEKLGVDVEAFGVTGDLTAIVSLIEARDALGEANPQLLPDLPK